MSSEPVGRYIERTYRTWITGQKDLVGVKVAIKETDLLVRVNPQTCEPFGLQQTVQAIVVRERKVLDSFIRQHPTFRTTLVPYEVPAWAPWIAKRMAEAAKTCGVGPMAAVAGAFAAAVGEELTGTSREVIVENGGDIFLASAKPRTIAVFAGESPFTGRLGIRLYPCQFPLGICSSAGTVGPSLSFGCADCAMAISRDAALADAVATAAGNRVQGPGDLQDAVDWAISLPGIIGALTIKDDQLAVAGDLELVRLQ